MNLKDFDTAARQFTLPHLSDLGCNVNSADSITSMEKFRRHSSYRAMGCIPSFASFANRLFAIGSQLSPEQGSSGIEMLETDTFKLHCFQTLTGLYFQIGADWGKGLAKDSFGKHCWGEVAFSGTVTQTHLSVFVNPKPIFNLTLIFVHTTQHAQP